MFLFILDQVAGAEYVAPLLTAWRGNATRVYAVYASPVSAKYLARHNIPHTVCQSLTTAEIRGIVKHLQPRVGILSSSLSSTLERSFLDALRIAAVPVAQFVDAWVNLTERFRRESAEPRSEYTFPDYILVIDDDAKRSMVAGGVPADIIEVVGQPHFEAEWQSYAANAVEPGALRALPNLIVTQPVSRFWGRTLGYDERDFVALCLAGLRGTANAGRGTTIAVHPAEDLATYAAFRAAGSNLQVNIVQSPGLSIAKFGTVLGMFSTLMLHSYVAGVPTASVQPRALGEDSCFLSQRGMIPRLQTPEGLAAWLGDSAAATGYTVARAKLLASVGDSSTRFERFLDRFC